MFRGIGVVIIIAGFAYFLPNAFVALESAAVASFEVVETAAVVSEVKIQNL